MESSLQVEKTLLAISVFLAFVAWDIVFACKRRDKWIQGSGLTLTALSVQFLGYLDAQNLNNRSKEQELKVLLNNQLSVDNDRLVFCTFLACVLPGVAFHSSGGRWSNIAALAVSLCLHMSTEIYVLQNVNYPAFRNGARVMFISSSVLLLVAAIFIVLYIGLAIINCKFTRDRLNHKIAKMVEGRLIIDKMVEGSVKNNMPGESLESRMLDTNNFDVLKYWAIVRGCQQEFWLVSSAFSPAVLMIVTTCIAVVVAKAISRQSLLRHSNNSVRWTLCFQCVFILTGWAILIWRCAVFLLLYTSREKKHNEEEPNEEKQKPNFFSYPSYTMACRNRFFRLVYLFVQKAWNWSPLDDGSWCKRILAYVWKALRILVFFVFLIAILPISLFFVVIYFLVLFNFFWWWLSKLFARIIINIQPAGDCIDKIKELVSDAEVFLATEAKELLYVTESSVTEAKSVITKSFQNGKNAGNIVEVIKHSVEESRQVIRNRLSPTGDIYSYIGVWKMAAVTAISVLVDHGGVSKEIVKDAVQAYKEAQDLLEFLDFPDNITVNPIKLFNSGSSRAYQMSLEADIKIQKIEALVETNSYPRPPSKSEKLALVRRKILRSNFWRYCTGNEFVDKYNEGTNILIENSLNCVVEAILNESGSNKEELVNRAKSCLGDIIACGVLELQEVLPQYCKKWAEDFKEKNLIKALEIQEKFRAIKENWPSAESANKLPDGIIARGISHLQEVFTQYRRKWADEGNLIKAREIQEKFREIEEMLTSTDTAPPKGPEENKLAEVTEVDVGETERDIGHEIIDVEAR